MKNKKFPLDFDYDSEEGILSIYLNDSTLIINVLSYKRCHKFQKQYFKEHPEEK